MIFDARSSELSDSFDVDICVFGCGAMGIALAREFIDFGARVLIVESGDEEADHETQSLYDMTSTGILPRSGPYESRLRYLGGATNHRGGWNRPYDKSVIDKWPVEYEELERYFSRTTDVLDLQHRNFDAIEAWGQREDQYFADLGPGIISEIRQIRALKMWQEYKDVLSDSENVTILKNANLFDLEFTSDKNAVQSAVVKTLSDDTKRITAKHFVLASGGLENPQILLNIDRLSGGVFSSKSDAIGKYYMDHVGLEGDVVPLKCMNPKLADHRQFAQYNIQPDEEKKYFFVRPGFLLDPSVPDYKHFPRHYFTVGDFHPQCSYQTKEQHEDLYGHSRFLWDAKKAGANPQVSMAPLFLDFAPIPNASSTVTLTEQKNALGHFVGNLHWQFHEQQEGIVSEISNAFEKRMAKNGLARVRLSHYVAQHGLALPDGSFKNDSHHMGATRMATSPKDGVVDKNCKVHGLNNFFISGASVFPTYDWSGPTFTAIALALRLSDHLKQRL